MEKLLKIVAGHQARFPKGIDPFQMITRLAEECGELAREVNHFENSGIKREKYGQPDKNHLAKEIRDVLCCTLEVAVYYGVLAEVEANINQTIEQMKGAGWLA